MAIHERDVDKTIGSPAATARHLKLADDIFRCRACRDQWPAFDRDTGSRSRHPEMAHGSANPTILIISINPKLDANRVPDSDLHAFLSRATSSASVVDANPFDLALAKALPRGYGLKERNVTNTRVYKCATPTETEIKGVAPACADRFLAREISILQPQVVLAMGKSAWPEVFRVLHAGEVPTGCGPHACAGTVDGRRVPLVASWHLTGNVSARSDSYRFAVRRLLCDALTIARDV